MREQHTLLDEPLSKAVRTACTHCALSEHLTFQSLAGSSMRKVKSTVGMPMASSMMVTLL
jgi:hypothetical protein